MLNKWRPRVSISPTNIFQIETLSILSCHTHTRQIYSIMIRTQPFQILWSSHHEPVAHVITQSCWIRHAEYSVTMTSSPAHASLEQIPPPAVLTCRLRTAPGSALCTADVCSSLASTWEKQLGSSVLTARKSWLFPTLQELLRVKNHWFTRVSFSSSTEVKSPHFHFSGTTPF